MGFDPTSAPCTHCAVGGAHSFGNLLLALFRMGMGRQNDLRSHCQRLWSAMRSYKSLKLLDFFDSESDWISGFGTSHRFVPPKPSLSSRTNTVKPGKNL